MAFRKFNQDALDKYAQWIKEKHQVDITMKDIPALPPFVSMLAGNADAMAENPKGTQWPVIVKKVWQSAFGDPKTIPEIISARENFYVEKDTRVDKYTLKTNTPVYYACQNVLMTLGNDALDLILFSERSSDIMVVGVKADPQFYKANLMFLKEYLHSKGL